MASPPVILLPNSVVFISTRTQEGLPIVATAFMRVILEGILARAQKQFKVTVCHFIFMSNHLHLLLKVDNPELIPAFMDRVKTETGHAINRLLGRVQRSVWCKKYDTPPVLTIEDVINKIKYLYTNPQAVDIIEDIERYPGFSSWNMFVNKRKGFVAKWIRRPFITKLEKTELSEEEQVQIAKNLLSKAKKRLVFRLSANAWMSCFGITDPNEIEEINNKIIRLVKEAELELEAKRIAEGRKVMGAEKLKAQPMDIAFSPKKFAKRMYCICHDKKLRIAFIDFVKDLLVKAKEVKDRWLQGDFSVPYPFGLFPPRVPRQGNLLPSVLKGLALG